MSVDIDVSQVRQLARDLGRAGPMAHAAVQGVVEGTALRIKRQARQIASGHRRLPKLSSAIGYDINRSPLGTEAVIGYAKSGQGNLGNIAEFGTSTQAPIAPALGPSLEAQQERFPRELERAVAESSLASRFTRS